MTSYLLHLLIYLDLFIILAISLNLVVGYCGIYSLAHSGFYALGAYSYAILSIRSGASFPLVLLGTTGLGMLASLSISIPTRRLKGDQALLLTMVVQVLIYSALYNWYEAGEPLGTFQNMTNGPYGIVPVPKLSLLGLSVDSRGGMAIAATLLALGAVGIVWVLTRSPWGRLLKAIRDDETAARGLGKRVHSAQAQALALGCGLASFAGAIYASYVGYLHPSMCSLDASVMLMAMILVGGLGNLRGPAVGAALFLIFPELLRFIDIPETVAANLRAMLFGILIVALVHLRPQGVAGLYAVK